MVIQFDLESCIPIQVQNSVQVNAIRTHHFPYHLDFSVDFSTYDSKFPYLRVTFKVQDYQIRFTSQSINVFSIVSDKTKKV